MSSLPPERFREKIHPVEVFDADDATMTTDALIEALPLGCHLFRMMDMRWVLEYWTVGRQEHAFVGDTPLRACAEAYVGLKTLLSEKDWNYGKV